MKRCPTGGITAGNAAQLGHKQVTTLRKTVGTKRKSKVILDFDKISHDTKRLIKKISVLRLSVIVLFDLNSFNQSNNGFREYL